MTLQNASDSGAVLYEICRRHVLPSTFRIAIQKKANARLDIVEPYIPLIPRNWNGTLVLAEAQNIAGDRVYAEWLVSATPDQRIGRLGHGGAVGIQPWDDGSLKLAVESAFGIEAYATAVSNAVLWSLVDGDGRNRNPTQELIRKSQVLWTEMLAAMKPAHIVTAGAISRRVIAAALKTPGHRCGATAWPLPSPRVMSPISSTAVEGEMLRRFPEVARVIDRHPGWVGGTHRKNKILYACLAVAATHHAETIGVYGVADGIRRGRW